MADTKISSLTELTVSPDPTDELVVVDKSDTSMAASGTDKRLQYSNLLPDAIVTSRKLKPTFGVVRASGTVTITATSAGTAQDLTGATVTFSPATASTAIVTGIFDFRALGSTVTSDLVIIGALDVDGSHQAGTAIYSSKVVAASGTIDTRASVANTWVVNLTAASHTLKLAAYKSATGTGTASALLTNTALSYLVVSQ